MAYNTKFDGTFINSSQPGFMAYRSTNTGNVTGNGTAYTVIFDTENFDQGGVYNNTNGIFTAPVTGLYYFCTFINMYPNSNSNYGDIVFTGSASSIYGAIIPTNASGVAAASGNLFLYMTANDTMKVVATWYSNGSDNMQVTGAATGTGYGSFFAGYLLG